MRGKGNNFLKIKKSYTAYNRVWSKVWYKLIFYKEW